MRSTSSAIVGSRTADEGPTPELSIVSPVYMGEESVAELVALVREHASQVTADFEIILVEDRGPDRSWERIVDECAQDPRVKGIRLSRNFGQHLAITAGLEAARGKWVIVMDCDLQDHPKYIPDLYAEAQRGADIVFTRKISRGHSRFRNVTGSLFGRVMSFLTGSGRPTAEHSAAVGNYSIISRKVVDAVLSMGDFNRQYLASLRYAGFDRSFIDTEHYPRKHGRSSYNFRRLVTQGLADATAESYRLLHLSVAAGFAFVAFSIVAFIVTVVRWYLHGFLEGWASVICLMLASTGVILTSLGVLGLYLGRVLDEARGRPVYLVSQAVNVGRTIDLRAEALPGIADDGAVTSYTTAAGRSLR